MNSAGRQRVPRLRCPLALENLGVLERVHAVPDWAVPVSRFDFWIPVKPRCAKHLEASIRSYLPIGHLRVCRFVVGGHATRLARLARYGKALATTKCSLATYGTRRCIVQGRAKPLTWEFVESSQQHQARPLRVAGAASDGQTNAVFMDQNSACPTDKPPLSGN